MITRVHTPTMEKTDIIIQAGGCCSPGVFFACARACGLVWGLGAGVWRACWVFGAWRGAPP